MRRSKQIILTITLTVALAGLAWSAGRSRGSVQLARIIVARQEIAAGTLLQAADLDVIELPAQLLQTAWVTDLQSVVGKRNTTDLLPGEILCQNRIVSAQTDFHYPGSGPGRRLMTVRLDAAAANGYWLTEGSLVDIYLVPGSPAETGIQVLHNIRIAKIMDASAGADESYAAPGTDPLICFDLSPDQAVLLACAENWYTLEVAAIGDSYLPPP